LSEEVNHPGTGLEHLMRRGTASPHQSEGHHTSLKVGGGKKRPTQDRKNVAEGGNRIHRLLKGKDKGNDPKTYRATSEVSDDPGTKPPD